MTTIKTRIRVASDGTLTGRAAELPVGEHDAEILLLDTDLQQATRDPIHLLASVRAIQAEVALLPVIDPREPDDILGYNKHGHLD